MARASRRSSCPARTLKKHVTTGELIHLPASAFHSTLNTGTKQLKLFVVYEKAGPEAFLRSLPDCTVLPPKRTGAR